MSLLRILLLLFFFLLLGCEDAVNSDCINMGCEQVGEESSGNEGDAVLEETIPSDTYVAGLEKVGEKDYFTATLQESAPIPKDIGKYTWTLSIKDQEGQLVTNAEIIAEPVMPAHGHGTIPAFTNGVESEDGSYQLSEMYLYMPGVWEVIIRVTSEDGLEDTIYYRFDLDG